MSKISFRFYKIGLRNNYLFFAKKWSVVFALLQYVLCPILTYLKECQALVKLRNMLLGNALYKPATIKPFITITILEQATVKPLNIIAYEKGLNFICNSKLTYILV